MRKQRIKTLKNITGLALKYLGITNMHVVDNQCPTPYSRALGQPGNYAREEAVGNKCGLQTCRVFFRCSYIKLIIIAINTVS